MMIAQDCKDFIESVSVSHGSAVDQLKEKLDMIEQTDGFEIMNQIMAVKIKKPNKGNNQTDRSGRSNQLRMNSNGSDFRWSDF